jgi:hypothetical protein
MRPSIDLPVIQQDSRYYHYVEEGQEYRVDIVHPPTVDFLLDSRVLDWMRDNAECAWSIDIEPQISVAHLPMRVTTSNWVCTYSFADLQTATHFRLKF